MNYAMDRDPDIMIVIVVINPPEYELYYGQRSRYFDGHGDNKHV